MRDLGIGAGLAYGTNNGGEVVGEYNGQAFIYSLRRGKMQILGTLGGSQFVNYSYATCINNIGQVAGVSTIPALPIDEHVPLHAFLYSDETMRDLTSSVGRFDYSEAYSINDRGQVVGELEVQPFSHAFLYSSGTTRDLGTLGSDPSSSVAYSINDHGQIVGSAAGHAFLYSDGKMRDLGTLGGQSSTANCINNRGEVVGSSETADGGQIAFLYRGCQMLDLNTLITPNSGPPLASATRKLRSG
jgi:probable HAF family extracellular repeat protein